MRTRNKFGIIQILLISSLIVASTIPVSARFSPEIQEQDQEKQTILYIVDGIEMPTKKANKIDPADIEMIEIIKETDKIQKYTEQKVDMLVLITMMKKKGIDTTAVKKEE